MKNLLLLLLCCVSFSFAQWEDIDFGDDSEREDTQEVVKQMRAVGKRRAETYYVKTGTKVYLYNNPRGALRRKYAGDEISKEIYVEKSFKPGQKVKIIPLDCGIGLIRRKNMKHSYYYVLLSLFESEEEKAKRIAEENAPKPVQLKLGSAECSADAIMFVYHSDYDTYIALSQQADEAALLEWCQAMAESEKAYIAKKGDKVIIVEIEGDTAKVMKNRKTYRMSTKFLQSL